MMATARRIGPIGRIRRYREIGVVLTGNVRSWAERQEAERAARAAPGLTQIDDRITITP